MKDILQIGPNPTEHEGNISKLSFINEIKIGFYKLNFVLNCKNRVSVSTLESHEQKIGKKVRYD